MTLTKLKLKPGIQKQTSDLGASGGYVDCDNVRFRYGLPEKIGGWEKTTTNTLITFAGITHMIINIITTITTNAIIMLTDIIIVVGYDY